MKGLRFFLKAGVLVLVQNYPQYNVIPWQYFLAGDCLDCAVSNTRRQLNRLRHVSEPVSCLLRRECTCAWTSCWLCDLWIKPTNTNCKFQSANWDMTVKHVIETPEQAQLHSDLFNWYHSGKNICIKLDSRHLSVPRSLNNSTSTL